MILLKPLESMYTNGSVTSLSRSNSNIFKPIVEPTWLETKKIERKMSMHLVWSEAATTTGLRQF